MQWILPDHFLKIEEDYPNGSKRYCWQTRNANLSILSAVGAEESRGLPAVSQAAALHRLHHISHETTFQKSQYIFKKMDKFTEYGWKRPHKHCQINALRNAPFQAQCLRFN
jgi:hypothetical protein